MLMLSVSVFGAGRPEAAARVETASLNAFLMGPGRQRDSDMVWEAFNGKLCTYLPGTSLDIDVITASDFRERWQLTMAANERVDIVWRGLVMNLDDEVNK